MAQIIPIDDLREEGGSGSARSEATGTQCIRRSFAIMRMLASGDQDGEKLVDIAGALKLSHPTAHRILKALEQEGMVERARGSHRYRLGAEAIWLGVAPFNRCPITRYASRVLDGLVRGIGDSVFLSVPSHTDAVYADRRLGNYPVQAKRVAIGARRPLGVSVGGRVMLACMGEERMDAILRENAERFRQWNCPGEFVVNGIAKARASGFLVADSVTADDRRALAVPVRDMAGNPIGAISIIASRGRLGAERVGRLVPLLQSAAREVSDTLHHQRMSA